MKYISMVFDILILILGIKYTFKRYRYKKRIDIFITVNVMICLYYGLIPLMIKIFNYQFYSGYMKSLEYIDDTRYLFVSLICFLLYSIFLIINRKTPTVFSESEMVIQTKNNVQISTNFQDYRMLKLFAYLCFIIGTLSFFIIAYSVGGVVQLLKIGDLARGYGKDLGNLISRNLLPIRTLMPVILVSPFLFYTMSKYKNTVINKIMFLISFIISILYLIFNAGRAPILTFVFPFLFLYFDKKYKNPWFIMLVIFIITIPALKWLDDLFLYLSYGTTKSSINDISIIKYFIIQFGYPYANILNAEKMIDYFGLRLGIDYFTWIINIIPVSILSKLGLWKVDVITDYITIYYAQLTYVKRIMGGVPVDLFTLGYLQLGFLGAIIFVVAFSYVVKILDKKSYNDRYYHLKQIIYLRIAIAFMFIVPNISLDSIVRGRSDIIILIFLIIITHKLSYRYIK